MHINVEQQQQQAAAAEGDMANMANKVTKRNVQSKQTMINVKGNNESGSDAHTYDENLVDKSIQCLIYGL